MLNQLKGQSGTFADARMIAALGSMVLSDGAATEAGRLELKEMARREMLRSQRQASCAKNSRLAILAVDGGATMASVENRYFCKQPTCAICAQHKAFMLHREVMSAYDRAQERVPGIIPLTLTLTQPTTPPDELAAGIDRLHAAQRIFQKTTAYLRAFAGAFRRTEINWMGSHWHVHSHILLIAYPDYCGGIGNVYLSHNQLTDMWKGALGVREFISINVQKICHLPTGASDPSSVRAGVSFAAAYAVKPLDLLKRAANGKFVLEPELAHMASRGIYGKRLHAFSGVMRSVWKGGVRS